METTAASTVNQRTVMAATTHVSVMVLKSVFLATRTPVLTAQLVYQPQAATQTTAIVRIQVTAFVSKDTRGRTAVKWTCVEILIPARVQSSALT
jgi:hypothetical protein